MVICFAGAIYSAHNPAEQVSPHYPHPRFSLHLSFSLVLLIAFFGHGAGSNVLPPTGDNLVFAISVLSAVILSVYFAVFPPHNSEVDLRRSVAGKTSKLQVSAQSASFGRRSRFLLLVVSYPATYLIPPASSFVIYDKRGGWYPFMHSHPFPVFSSSVPGRLVFLIQCRSNKSVKHPSFTKVLYKNINKGLYPERNYLRSYLIT